MIDGETLSLQKRTNLDTNVLLDTCPRSLMEEVESIRGIPAKKTLPSFLKLPLRLETELFVLATT